MQLTLNLGQSKAGIALVANFLDIDGVVLSTVSSGYLHLGNGSYTWTLTPPLRAVTLEITDADDQTLVAGAISSLTTSEPVPPSVDTAVALSEMKTYLRLVDDGEQDQTLVGMLAAAQSYVQSECDLTLLPTVQTMVLDHFPHHTSIRLPIGPVLSVASIAYEASAGHTITMPTTDYRLTRGERFGVLKAVGDWPSTPSTIPDAVTITYTTGYASREAIPATLTLAIKMIVAAWFTQNPEAWSDRTITENPALKRILDLYRAWNF